MKKLVLLVFFSSLVMINGQTIKIFHPAANDTLELFNNYTIEWFDDIDDAENLLISLYKGSMRMKFFYCQATGATEWNFFTPTLESGTDYKIKIERNSNSTIYDETGYFTIKGTNNVSGRISGDWTLENSPYILSDSVFVESQNSINIEPGVKIIGSKYFNNFDIFGNITARGEQGLNVVFENVNLKINGNDKSDSSKIQYTTFHSSQEDNEYITYTTFGKSYLDEGNCIIRTEDGGYMIAGSSNFTDAYGHDVWLIKTDKNKNIIWDKVYQEEGYEYSSSVFQTEDGGYIVGGSESEGYAFDGFLMKVTAQGEMEWKKIYGTTGYKDMISSIIKTNDGIIISGYTSAKGNGRYDVWLVKTDLFGNLLWDKTYGTEWDDNGYSVIKTSDGGFVLTGRWGGNGSQLWIIKTDADGNEIWNKIYGGTDPNDMDWGNEIIETSEGGYAVIGKTESYGAEESDIWLIKTDQSGNIEWNNTYGGIYFDSGNSIIQNNDGSFFILGSTNNNWMGSGGDAWLIKTDIYGNEEWSQTYGGSSGDEGKSFCKSYEGGLIIICDTWSFGAGWSDILMLKTDINGNMISGEQCLNCLDDSKVVIQNCTIQNLNSYGIIAKNSSPVISNNLITGNEGGIKLRGSSSQYIVNNTIADNDSTGIWFEGNSDISCINNIIYGNGIYQVFIADDESDPSFYYNDIQGGQSAFGFGWGVIYNGIYENNIDSDPLFLDNYSIFVNSPCFDSGIPGLDNSNLGEMYIPLYDIFGNPRIFSYVIDIGCYEAYEVGIEDAEVPATTELYQNYPNPFNPVTKISYSLKSEAQVKLSVFNTKGELINKLVDERKTAGNHSVNFSGEGFNSGIYLYKLEVNGSIVDSKRMLMLK